MIQEDVIELVYLTKKYGSSTAVDHLTLSIRKGEIFGLLGPNGAGKSTTILMMLGLTEPTSGVVKVCGINSTTNPIEVKKKVGYLPEDVGFYDDRSGRENLIYTARLNRLSVSESQKQTDELLARVGLAEAADKKTGKYSRGMRQRLGLADVLIKKPEIIILDEPTLGIDPKGVREFLDLIVKLSREEGLTVLLSSHDLHQMQKVCDRVGLFVAGKLLASGDIHSLSQKLFSTEPFVIDAGVSLSRGNGKPDPMSEEELQRLLRNVEGVVNIQRKNDMWEIICSRDVTQEVARTIVQAGVGLNYLHKKEYGLNEIYHHYFEHKVEQKEKFVNV